MTQAEARPLRLWPGVVIVALQMLLLYVTPLVTETATMAMAVGLMAPMGLGLLVLLPWWLFFSRAAWRDRLLGAALLVVVHLVTLFFLVDASARIPTVFLGIPWVCLAFVASLFLGVLFLAPVVYAAVTRRDVAMRLAFFASIVYLPLLLAVMVLDRVET